MARRVRVGVDFDGEIKVIEAKRKANVDQVRTWIVVALLVVGIIALVVAGGVSFWDGNFSKLQTVWNVIGPLFGAALAYYFNRRNDHGDDKSRED
jgi:hypothetical protein